MEFIILITTYSLFKFKSYVMKLLFFFALLAQMLICSCNKQNVSPQNKELKTLTGTFTVKDLSRTIEIDGRKFTFEVKSEKLNQG